MDSANLRQLFDLFDRNGDGEISQKEFTESIGRLGIQIPAEMITQMMKTIDLNGNGCLDVEGFRVFYTMIMEAKESGGGGGDMDMREAFNLFDKDGDGFITAEELRVVLASLGLKEGRSIEDCKQLIMKVDVDDDGRVSFEEFLQMMKGRGFATSTN